MHQNQINGGVSTETRQYLWRLRCMLLEGFLKVRNVIHRFEASGFVQNYLTLIIR